MSNDRNAKAKPALGLDGAVLTLTTGLSSEAVTNLKKMVTEIAQKYGDNDSTMLRRFQSALRRALRSRTNMGWASEIQAQMERATA